MIQFKCKCSRKYEDSYCSVCDLAGIDKIPEVRVESIYLCDLIMDLVPDKEFGRYNGYFRRWIGTRKALGNLTTMIDKDVLIKDKLEFLKQLKFLIDRREIKSKWLGSRVDVLLKLENKYVL